METIASVFGLCGLTFGLVGMATAMAALSKIKELEIHLSAIETPTTTAA